jgi:hypothetical protein
MRLRPDFAVASLTLLLCASCAQFQLPPAELLADCQEPAASVSTNGLLAKYALDLRTALRSCNDDKAALREWAKEIQR